MQFMFRYLRGLTGYLLIRCKNNLLFDVFLTVHHSIDFSKYQLNAQFFYSSTIYMLHYAPRLLTEGDDTRGCGDRIGPPDDE